MARAIAGRILKFQRCWADWMNRQFMGLSPIKRNLLLLAVGLLLGSWSLVLIFSKAPRPVAMVPTQGIPRQVSPSDSLVLMEYIYKNKKK